MGTKYRHAIGTMAHNRTFTAREIEEYARGVMGGEHRVSAGTVVKTLLSRGYLQRVGQKRYAPTARGWSWIESSGVVSRDERLAPRFSSLRDPLVAPPAGERFVFPSREGADLFEHRMREAGYKPRRVSPALVVVRAPDKETRQALSHVRAYARDNAKMERGQGRVLVTPPPSPVTRFALRLARGERLDSRADRQFYANHAEAIERELQSIRSAGSRRREWGQSERGVKLGQTDRDRDRDVRKDIDELRSLAAMQGWNVEKTGSGHWKFVPPDPNKRIVITSSTPSDRQAIHRMRADLRKSGLDLGGAR